MRTEIKKKENVSQAFVSVTPRVMTVVIGAPANDNNSPSAPDLPPANAMALRAAA
jgi:hypothetical protein